jgi:hypothetical protein
MPKSLNFALIDIDIVQKKSYFHSILRGLYSLQHLNFGDAPNFFSLSKLLNTIPTRMPRKACIDAPGAFHHIFATASKVGQELWGRPQYF